MSNYRPSPDLVAAKEVAQFLNRPLLLAGEPGTGKTSYAAHVSSTENKELYVFNTKSISQAQDLFFTYDAVGHFANKEKSAIEFIKLEALGKSIINSVGIDLVKEALLETPNANF